MPPKTTKVGTSKASAAERRALFVCAYLANGHNAAQAAIAAGYSEKTARVQGARLLTDVNVRQQLAEVARVSTEKANLNTEEAMCTVGHILRADPRRLVRPDGSRIPLQDLDEATAAAIASFDLADGGGISRVKFWSKVEALDKVMKHLGLFERDNRQRQESLAIQVNLVGTPGREQ